MTSQIKKQLGFTLAETLFSISIFGVVLTAVMFILVRNSNDAQFIKNSYIASGLVQEGIEVVRNLRDNEWSSGKAWGALVQDGTWSVQWDSLALGINPAATLNKDANGFYTYAAGAVTPFSRSISITSINTVEKKIVATVSWNEKGAAKILSAEEHLYNWR